MPRNEKSHGALVLVIGGSCQLAVQLAASWGACVQTAFCALVAISVALVNVGCDMATVTTNVFSSTALGQFDAAERRSFGQSAVATFLAISTARFGSLRLTTATTKDCRGIDRGGVVVVGMIVIVIVIVVMVMVVTVVVIMSVIARARGGVRCVAVTTSTAAVATP